MTNTPPTHNSLAIPARHPSARKAHVGLAIMLLLALVMGLAPASAQESIEDARQQREDAREAELEARAALDVLEAEWEDIQIAFEAADELVQLAEGRSVAVQAQLELAVLRLRQTEVAIAWAEYDRDVVGEQLADLAIQEYLGMQQDDTVLGSGSLNEAMTRNTVLDAVQGAGYDVIDIARTAADRGEELLEQAVVDIAEVERLESELDEEREDLDAALAIRAKARDALDARLDEWEDVIAEWEDIEQGLTDFIRVEQQRADIASALEAVQSTTGYTWPTAGGIGSYFGYRVHPVLGYSRLHGGLDIGGRMGQPIWAAKEGVVIMARVNGGYGNTIIIDHGNGFASLYGHQSSFEVREGDVVETGQHIGNVGSTGLSTGPHLHFEIRQDGGVIDPLPFLPPR